MFDMYVVAFQNSNRLNFSKYFTRKSYKSIVFCRLGHNFICQIRAATGNTENWASSRLTFQTNICFFVLCAVLYFLIFPYFEFDFANKMYKISENIVILSFLLFLFKVNAQNNDQDYMRRQHSLVKPYQGKQPHAQGRGHSEQNFFADKGQGHL